jgi:hypothetical protein
MNKIILFVSFIILALYGNAQVNSGELGPAETFAARKGTILEKRFDEINKIGNLNIQLEYLTDLTNRDKMECIRFDIQPGENVSGPSALLDTNEVNEIISFLVYISNNVTNCPPVDPNTEISFTGKYNMQVGCFWQKNNGWTLFLRTDAQNAATEADIPQLDIPVLLKDLNLAKSEIKKE